jgi:ATPase subunit of ABC transporter with duplicated ATPase domains
MLIDYEGTILFVSHDRYFINKVADKIIEIEEKKLKVYTGDYNYYLEEYEKYQLKQETLAASSPVNKPKVKENKTTEKVRIGNNNINGRKLELIEFDIEKMENRLKVLEEELIIHSQNYEKLNLIYKEKEDINHSLLKAYSQWEDLQQV